MPSSAFHWITTSRAASQSASFALAERQGQKYLAVQGEVHGLNALRDTEGEIQFFNLTALNAVILRKHLPWLRPVPLGIRPSFGFGDRLGIATPGHALAARESHILPVFAQQSVRENDRTERNPQSVLDDAMWGVFESGWRKPWGADADHLKTLNDLPAFVKAGYTFFTIDPGVHVRAVPTTQGAQESTLTALPWNHLETSLANLKKAYVQKRICLPGFSLLLTEDDVVSTLITYGHALAHVKRLYHQLKNLMDGKPFDFEVSVDETNFPTTPAAHFILASEMIRLGVNWTSLAPRFIGRFEKGVDYIGDPDELNTALKQHAAVLSNFGHYKISLHSGSDKFRVYPLLAEHFGDKVHVKTAGTSYLEALRVIARRNPDFFRSIYDLSRQVYPRAKATYHVSAALSRAPVDLPDADLPHLLDQFDARQILHVAYGEVLEAFGSSFVNRLKAKQDAYNQGLYCHFRRHLALLNPSREQTRD